jgi:hypothetical protein
MDLSAQFRIGDPSATPVVVRSPHPVSNGPYGVPIVVATVPAGVAYPCLPLPSSPFYSPPSVALGKEVRLIGRTDPLVAGQLMTIRTERAGEVARDIATVRVAADGSFSYPWRPSAPGDYAVGAHYRSQTPSLTNDFSGTTGLRVTAPPVKTSPTAIRAARLVRCRGLRCRITVRGSVKRPPAVANVRCTGKLRLRVADGKRRVLSKRARVFPTCRYRATARFRLKSSGARFVKVRVSYLGDATLHPKHGPAVRTKIRRGR